MPELGRPPPVMWSRVDRDLYPEIEKAIGEVFPGDPERVHLATVRGDGGCLVPGAAVGPRRVRLVPALRPADRSSPGQGRPPGLHRGTERVRQLSRVHIPGASAAGPLTPSVPCALSLFRPIVHPDICQVGPAGDRPLYARYVDGHVTDNVPGRVNRLLARAGRAKGKLFPFGTV